MNARGINASLLVAGQVRPEDLAEIAAAGFRAIICNHPDGEGADQPLFAEIAAEPRRHGLDAIHLPVASGKVGREDTEVSGPFTGRLARPVPDPQPGWTSVGGACDAPNAKTAAAARKQAPVVAGNLLKDMGAVAGSHVIYDGHGPCPLTVQRGKLLPRFPKWFIDGTKPRLTALLLKERILPPVYRKAMLTGREWMAKPELTA